ncbi:DUF1631 domain-containing protein [Rhodoferax sp. PAMC 29310]|uniref:DUF1631 domain-containing protein n=1 Tax=Rhodoferax sp. PAMC 29310 TaxID=2822760 RepID=UPI001B33B2D7|nr:DUF1631 domain-containing protein [Rhodoferax sp. PAMC 29310]
MPIHSPIPNDVASREATVFAYRHLRGLVGQTLAYFAAHETENLASVRDHLLEMAEARPSLERMQNLRSASHVLKQHADKFNSAFQETLQAAMDAELTSLLPNLKSIDLRGVTDFSPVDGIALSLVDMDEVERILLVDRVTQKFNVCYDSSVSALTLRLGFLVGHDAQYSNPFRPEVFVRSFLSAWETCAFDEQATEDLMLGFDPAHSVDLTDLYAELNATLIKAGIEARVVHRIKKSEGGVSAYASLGSDSSPGALTSTDDSRQGERGPERPEPEAAPSAWRSLAPVGQQIAAQARQFLTRLGFVSPLAAPDSREQEGLVWMESDRGDAQSPHAPADPEFMGYLGEMQSGAGVSTSSNGLARQAPGDQNILRQMRDSEEVRRAPELDRGTVDALAEVFDFVFADQSIPLQMKYVIGRLQIPVLKAAMIDRDFFLSGEHPARRLVDTLASASVEWAPEKGEDDPLYQRIETTVMRVLNEFEDDLSLFSDLLREFTEFLFESEQQLQGRIEPAADVERSDESLEQALAQADETIALRIQASSAQLRLVPFLTPFLTNPWREVMARAWLTVEEDSAPWDRAVATMEQLIWSTEPKVESDDRRKLVAVLPDLVRHLNVGLDAIDWSGDARATFTRRLIATHMLAIRMTKSPAADTETAELDETASQQAIQALDQRRSEKLAGSNDDFDAAAQKFTRGLWFEFAGESSLNHRCRLSWISPMRTRFLFTNRDGFDAFVRTEREVAALLRLGRLRVIDQEPIISRALDRIMTQTDPRQVA